MLIYKILTAKQWAQLETNSSFAGAPVDHADGYIHMSTADQAQGTADKHFAGQTELMLVAFDTAIFGDDLVWEKSRGGQDFPHIYNRTLELSHAVWARPIPLINGKHVLDMS